MSKVGSYMTPHPYTIGRDQPVAVASQRMREHRIRHLPVLDGGRLVGLISDRDVRLVEALSSEHVKVEEAMSPEPRCVSPDAPLKSVVRDMAEHKLGSVLVVDDNERMLGIFTAIDALKILESKL